jgi:hypothetical protein
MIKKYNKVLKLFFVANLSPSPNKVKRVLVTPSQEKGLHMDQNRILRSTKRYNNQSKGKKKKKK